MINNFQPPQLCSESLTSFGHPSPHPSSDHRGRRPATSGRRPIFVSDIFAHTELLAAPVFDAANERTRPNLKVQDGCDNRCSFCVIPYVRGQSRSLELSEIIREVNALVDSGYREVVISGINLGRWGRDLEARQTSDLGRQALADAQRPTACPQPVEGTTPALRTRLSSLSSAPFLPRPRSKNSASPPSSRWTGPTN